MDEVKPLTEKELTDFAIAWDYGEVYVTFSPNGYGPDDQAAELFEARVRKTVACKNEEIAAKDARIAELERAATFLKESYECACRELDRQHAYIGGLTRRK